MTATAATPRAYDPIDLSSRAFWSTSAQEREEAFAELRAERPVSWHPPVEDAMLTDPDDPGYWAVTRRDDIVAISRNNEVVPVRARASCSRTSRWSCSKRRNPSWRWTRRGTRSFANSSAPHSPRGRSGASRIRSRRTRRPSSRSSKPPAAAPISSTYCAKELPIRTLSDMVGIPESERQQPRARRRRHGLVGRPGVPQWSPPAGGVVRGADLCASGGRDARRGAPRASRRRPVHQPGERPRWTATGWPTPTSPRSSCCSPSPATTPPARPPVTR